jgi:hypothetical protein
MWDGGRFNDAACKSYEWRARDEEMVKVAESAPEQQASA